MNNSIFKVIFTDKTHWFASAQNAWQAAHLALTDFPSKTVKTVILDR